MITKELIFTFLVKETVLQYYLDLIDRGREEELGMIHSKNSVL